MIMKIEKSWYEQLQSELQKPYIGELKNFLQEEKNQGSAIYPPEHLIFNAFAHTPFDKVKVVIIGQDPYHGFGQAHGLCFSVSRGVNPPPSLRNVFKELQEDVAIAPPTHGCLDSWADQGVLLLNTILTVRAKEPLSHAGKGWELFTDAVIDALAKRTDPIVFLLWGKAAQEKAARVKDSVHTSLKSAHPSFYSAAKFFGCRHFSKTNALLQSWGKTPIDWSV
jgi:uracil-DNA glycosylase